MTRTIINSAVIFFILCLQSKADRSFIPLEQELEEPIRLHRFIHVDKHLDLACVDNYPQLDSLLWGIHVTDEDNCKRNTWVLNWDKDDFRFSYNTRTIFLDRIFVPDDYLITGVRLVEIEPTGGHKELKMQVKGTKFDATYRLIPNTDKWFDYSDNVAQENSYKRKRTEISLGNCTDPTLTTDYANFANTNLFVRFRSTDLKKDQGNHMIPYFSSEPADTNDRRPIRGVELSYKGREGYDGYITVGVFHNKSSVSSSRWFSATPTEIRTTSEADRIRAAREFESETGPRTDLATNTHCQFFIVAISLLLYFSLQ